MTSLSTAPAPDLRHAHASPDGRSRPSSGSCSSSRWSPPCSGTSMIEAFVEGDTDRASFTLGVLLMMVPGLTVVPIGLLMYPVLGGQPPAGRLVPGAQDHRVPRLRRLWCLPPGGVAGRTDPPAVGLRPHGGGRHHPHLLLSSPAGPTAHRPPGSRRVRLAHRRRTPRPPRPPRRGGVPVSSWWSPAGCSAVFFPIWLVTKGSVRRAPSPRRRPDRKHVPRGDADFYTRPVADLDAVEARIWALLDSVRERPARGSDHLRHSLRCGGGPRHDYFAAVKRPPTRSASTRSPWTPGPGPSRAPPRGSGPCAPGGRPSPSRPSTRRWAELEAFLRRLYQPVHEHHSSDLVTLRPMRVTPGPPPGARLAGPSDRRYDDPAPHARDAPVRRGDDTAAGVDR